MKNDNIVPWLFVLGIFWPPFFIFLLAAVLFLAFSAALSAQPSPLKWDMRLMPTDARSIGFLWLLIAFMAALLVFWALY